MIKVTFSKNRLSHPAVLRLDGALRFFDAVRGAEVGHSIYIENTSTGARQRKMCEAFCDLVYFARMMGAEIRIERTKEDVGACAPLDALRLGLLYILAMTESVHVTPPNIFTTIREEILRPKIADFEILNVGVGLKCLAQANLRPNVHFDEVVLFRNSLDISYLDAPDDVTFSDVRLSPTTGEETKGAAGIKRYVVMQFRGKLLMESKFLYFVRKFRGHGIYLKEVGDASKRLDYALRKEKKNGYVELCFAVEAGVETSILIDLLKKNGALKADLIYQVNYGHNETATGDVIRLSEWFKRGAKRFVRVDGMDSNKMPPGPIASVNRLR